MRFTGFSFGSIRVDGVTYAAREYKRASITPAGRWPDRPRPRPRPGQWPRPWS